MKKLLGVSIAAMLAVTPMLASADPATGNHLSNAAPTATEGSAPFKAVTVDSTAKIATTSYVQGAYNDAIAAVNKVNADKQANLMNGTGQNAEQISSTVKTTVGDAESATDTALVTEAAVRTAIDAAFNEAGGQTANDVKGLIDAAAGSGLAGSNGALSINVDDSTIQIDNDIVKVKAGGITATQLATNAVETAKINAKAVTTEKINDKAVTAAQIADNTITASQIANATITSTQLAADSVTSTQIADGAVGLAKIASGDKQGASDTTNYTNTKLANAAYVDETVATAVANKATKSGVTATISASTISGTVPVYTAWGADTNTTVAITAGITGAAYAEPAAPAQSQEPAEQTEP